MPYTVPQFNLDVGVWNTPDVPPAVSTYTTVGQLYFPKQTATEGFTDEGDFGLQAYPPPCFLRLPALTDIKLAFMGADGFVHSRTYVEVPAGTGRFYRVIDFDDAHKGFPNEYRVATLRKAFTDTLWPDPVT